MLRTPTRIAAGMTALTLALASATPAAARPFITDAQGSSVSASTALAETSSDHNSGTGFDWGYVAAGTGAVSLALIGIGGTAVGRRQRRTRSAAIAA